VLSRETNLVIILYQCEILLFSVTNEQDSTKLLSVAKFVKHMRHVIHNFGTEMRTMLKGSENEI
jgi:hypothetical protein